MKILVTGREGQLVRSLLERGADRNIVALGRPDLDLEIEGSARSAILANRPDIVINAAAYTNVDQAEDETGRAMRINGDAAGEVAGAAHEVGAPIIHVSTDYVFDGLSSEAYSEHDQTNPIGAYGRSKLLGEQRVRDANRRHAIVRTSWVYSPFGRNFVKTMMNAASTRDVLSVVDDQFGNPSSALDLADGIFAIVDQARPEVLNHTYHLAGTGATSWCGFARAIFAECDRIGAPSAEVKAILTKDWPTKATRPGNSVLDCAKFSAAFGFRMPDWRASVVEVMRRLA